MQTTMRAESFDNRFTSFKFRVSMLALLPFLMVTTVVAWISFKEMRSLSDEQIRLFSEKLHQVRQDTLKDYLDLALAAIAPVVGNSDLTDEEAQREVKRILNGLSYGKDGYYFVYDQQGTNLVHPIQSELVGQNLYDITDRQGDLVIRALLELAVTGGGYHQYYWNKPSTGSDELKIAYVVPIPRWHWMLGSGLYLDDIAAQEDIIRGQVDANIRANIFVILFIVVATLLLIVLLMVFSNLHESRLADKRLRGQARNFVKLQLQERRHFARELHDGINQLMVAVKFRVELAAGQVSKGSKGETVVHNLEAGLNILGDAIKEVRRISHALRPVLLDKMGLDAALLNLLDQFEERTGIKVERYLDLRAADRLPDAVEVTLYRVLQEALMNIERHAHAGTVVLHLERTKEWVKLVLQDDGRGIPVNTRITENSPGIGLTNMRERVELMGGQYSLESGRGRGTRVCAMLPCATTIARGQP